MINLLIVGALFGMVLGRIFRVYILIPACGLAIILALTDPRVFAQTFLDSCFNLAMILAAVQLGYLASLMASYLPSMLPNRRGVWASHP